MRTPLLPASSPDPAAPAAADAQGTLHRQQIGRLPLLAAAVPGNLRRRTIHAALVREVGRS